MPYLTLVVVKCLIKYAFQLLTVKHILSFTICLQSHKDYEDVKNHLRILRSDMRLFFYALWVWKSDVAVKNQRFVSCPSLKTEINTKWH